MPFHSVSPKPLQKHTLWLGYKSQGFGDIDFLPQLEESRRRLFGSLEPREAVQRISPYSPPVELRAVECVEDINGEWVPVKDLDGIVKNP